MKSYSNLAQSNPAGEHLQQIDVDLIPLAVSPAFMSSLFLTFDQVIPSHTRAEEEV
jgi:hypothetical protein